jgi:threonine dehydrogenase-like Zn-dependent dehydrogenase
MKALYLDAPGAWSVRDIPAPEMGPGEVLLRVRYVGMCGTDLSTFRGKNALVEFPRIPGHEISATIERAGSDVPAHLRPGTNVTLLPYKSCGNCPSCRQGRFNTCRANQTLGVQRDGAMAEWIVAPWEKLRTSDKLSLRELCLVEPLTIGAHAVARGRVTARDIVLVIGCGTVGLGAIAAAAHRGATVIALDMDDGKLAVAKRAGAAHTIRGEQNEGAAGSSVREQILALTNGDGPGVVIEAVGTPETFRLAVEIAAFAGRVVYIGFAKEPVSYETRWFVLKELDIMGSRNATPDDFQAVIEMLERREFPVVETIGSVVPLEKAGEALRAWSENPFSFRKIQVEIGAEKP